jgi:triosephosphate isomerase
VRTPLIGGNWKMCKDLARTVSFFETFRPLVEESEHCEIVICSSFLDLATAAAATRGTSIQIGAQNLHWAREGAFTGEVSGARIRASGCSHVNCRSQRLHIGGSRKVLSEIASEGAGLLASA